MAKKSSKPPKMNPKDMAKVVDIMASALERNGITPDQIMQAISVLNDQGVSGLYNEIYTYKKPDYSKMAGPLHPALEPLINKEELGEIANKMNSALSKLEKEDSEVAGKALVNALYYILAHQQELQAGEYSHLSFFAILHMMIVLKVKNATPVLLEFLRQDMQTFSFFLDGFKEEMAFAISELCTEDLKQLEDFMYESGLIPAGQLIVADGVTNMALTKPEKSTEIINWWSRVLQKFAEIDVDEINIDYIAKTVAQLNAKCLKPLVERLYEVKEVPFFEVLDYDELETLLTKGTDERRVHVDSIGNVVATVEKNLLEYYDDDDYDDDDEDDDDDDFFFFDDDDDDDDDDVELYKMDTFRVPELENGLLYRLEISIDNCPVDVVREVIVPSNIRLSWLGKVLASAMGWDGSHLNRFMRGRSYYALNSSPVMKREYENASDYALNELMSRKGSKIKWEYDFGDSWMHSVRLLEKIKNNGKTPILEVTKAQNACPPEDCGGVWGYAELLEAIKDKDHPGHDDWTNWLDPGFDPHSVSLKSLNSRLKRFL